MLELGLRRALNGRVNGGLADHPPRLASPTTSVSVVVTTCCEPVKLERCLRPLLACDYEHFEIIVVENRPGSASTRRMLAKSFGAVREMRYAEEWRPGLSRARNKGVMVARGELVAFIDDDTVLDPSWMRCFVERFERDDVDCVTGLILPLELETDHQLLLEQFAGFGKGFRRRTYRRPEPHSGVPVYPYTPGAIGSGANTILRRRVAL